MLVTISVQCHVFLQTQDKLVSSLTARATGITQRLSKPTESEAQILGRLFPSSSSRKRQTPPFDPKNVSCSSNAHSKKKAFDTKGRAVSVQVVLLRQLCQSIPRGKHRTSLRNAGRIQTVKLTRSMTPSEVSQQINRIFGHLTSNGWDVLDCSDNYLSVSQNQILDGNRAINRKGCLYLCTSKVCLCYLYCYSA